MQTQPIPLVNAEESAYHELAGGAPWVHNALVDARGAIRARPGLVAYGEAPSSALDSGGIVGLYATAGGQLFAVGNTGPVRPVFRVGSGSYSRLGGPRVGLWGSGRPAFAETEMLLVMAGGAAPQKVELASGFCAPLGGSPPEGSHVVAHSSRLFIDGGADYPARIHWSDVATGGITYAGHETWSYGVGTAGFTAAETRPDPVVAIAETASEIWAWGSQTLQLFVPDASYVVAPAGTLATGCSAPSSIIEADGEFAWLDERRRFVVSDGRSVTSISKQIQRQLDELARVSDCYGFSVPTTAGTFLVWTFPSHRITYAYQRGSGWGHWQSRPVENWGALGVACAHTRRDTNVTVAGMGDGRIVRFDEFAGADFSDPVRADIATGFLNRGTDARKHCARVRISLARETAPVGLLQLSYRDSPTDPWESPLTEELNGSCVVEFNSLGVYRYRQWRLTFPGSGRLTIAGIAETFEVGDA